MVGVASGQVPPPGSVSADLAEVMDTPPQSVATSSNSNSSRRRAQLESQLAANKEKERLLALKREEEEIKREQRLLREALREVDEK